MKVPELASSYTLTDESAVVPALRNGAQIECPFGLVSHSWLSRLARAAVKARVQRRDQVERDDRRQRQPADDGQRQRTLQLGAGAKPERERNSPKSVQSVVIRIGRSRTRAAS